MRIIQEFRNGKYEDLFMNRARIMPNPLEDGTARFVGQRDYENSTDISGSAIYSFAVAQSTPFYVATFDPIEASFNSRLLIALTWRYQLIGNTVIAEFYGLQVQQDID